MGTVSKRHMSERIAQKTGHQRTVVQEVIQDFMDEMVGELAKSNKLEFRDFGVFSVITRKARMGRNPRTGEPVHVPAKRTVSFKMGRLMRERLKQSL